MIEDMKRIIVTILLAAVAASAIAQTLKVTSPDGRQEACVEVSSDNGKTRISYSTWFDGRPIVHPSALDLTIDNHIWEKALAKKADKVENWFDNLVLDSHEMTSRDTVWANPYGERSEIRDAYNGAILHFVKKDASKYRLDIEIRAYDEGIALRYYLPMHPDAIYHRILAENTEFAFPEGTMAWYAQWAQADYHYLPLKDWPDESERPLTLKLADNLYAAVGEAAQIDFPRGKLKLSESKPNTVVTALNDNATDIVTPYALPWRVIMAADRLGDLLENNYIYLNLNEASAIEDESWIRPGKIIRETTLTTENSLKCIDFCAAHNMDYILYDWKWYGPSFDFNSDAR